MFGLRLEARAEGVAAIDPEDRMTDSHFPRSGTVGHAALLLIDRLTQAGLTTVALAEVVDAVGALAEEYRRYWSRLADDKDGLTMAVLELLEDHRLAEVSDSTVRILPAAWRYRAEVNESCEQVSLL